MTLVDDWKVLDPSWLWVPCRAESNFRNDDDSDDDDDDDDEDDGDDDDDEDDGDDGGGDEGESSNLNWVPTSLPHGKLTDWIQKPRVKTMIIRLLTKIRDRYLLLYLYFQDTKPV